MYLYNFVKYSTLLLLPVANTFKHSIVYDMKLNPHLPFDHVLVFTTPLYGLYQ